MRWLAILWLLLDLGSANASAQPQEAAQPPPTCSFEILSVSTTEGSVQGPRPAEAQWQAAALPDLWKNRRPDYGGAVWYRIDWQRNCTGARVEPVALLLEWVVMAGEVFVNDELLWSDARLTEPLSRSWNVPRYWRLPEPWLRDGVNTLWVRAVGVARQSIGMGRVHLGAPAEMQRLHDERWFRMRTLFLVNMIVSSVMAALFFCIWVVRREQSAYGWYALMTFVWVLWISNVLVTDPWPLSSTLMAVRADGIALLLSIACFCLFTFRFAERRLPRAERLLWTLSLAGVLGLLLAPDALVPPVQDLAYLIGSVAFVANGVWFAMLAVRTRRREHALFALCLLILIAGSMHDLLLLLELVPGPYPLSPFTSIAITLSLSGILGLRHADNVRRIASFNLELAEGIAQARTELASTLERQHALLLANTRLQDRLQIAHDLHDGVGGSLMHMMTSIELDEAPLQRQHILSMFKLIRDDLRQTIDSGASGGIEVPATPPEWIAPLRYRFKGLFDELDIASDWQVASRWRTPPSAAHCLALTRLVEEAMTNVLKHSRARRVRVTLQQPEATQLSLCIEDDGVGFDVAAVRQSGISVGMRSMHARIARVGGILEVSSRPGRTRLAAHLTLG